jgi:hypothetical protein
MVAAALAALSLSPLSLYHYRATVWWGRPAPVRVVLIRTDGDWAAAKVTAPGATQWVLLHRDRLVTWVADHASRFYCNDAPPGVVHALVGACQTYVHFQDDVAIRGPTDRHRVSRRFGRCAAPIVYASRLDPSYTEVENCAASGGTYFLHRGKVIELEIDGPGCDWAPPGIIRSLHGRCLLSP